MWTGGDNGKGVWCDFFLDFSNLSLTFLTLIKLKMWTDMSFFYPCVFSLSADNVACCGFVQNAFKHDLSYSHYPLLVWPTDLTISSKLTLPLKTLEQVLHKLVTVILICWYMHFKSRQKNILEKLACFFFGCKLLYTWAISIVIVALLACLWFLNETYYIQKKLKYNPLFHVLGSTLHHAQLFVLLSQKFTQSTILVGT